MSKKRGGKISGTGRVKSSGSSSRSRSRRRRRRPGTRRRQLLVVACLSAVAGSLFVSVNRTAGGRELAETISELRTEEQVLLTRLSEELVRVDSLSSRERILVAGARYGLRPASDDEVLHLPDVGP